jgi:hypothetical protein
MSRWLPALALLAALPAFAEEAPVSEATPERLPIVALRLKPIALFSGIPGAELNVGVARFLAIDLGFQYFSSEVNEAGSFHVAEYTLALDFFLGGERFKSSWFIKPKCAYLPLVLGSDHAFSSTFSILAGRYWALPAGLNASLGGGVTIFSSSGSIVVSPTTGMLEISDSNRRVAMQPVIELMVGWAF